MPDKETGFVADLQFDLLASCVDEIDYSFDVEPVWLWKSILVDVQIEMGRTQNRSEYSSRKELLAKWLPDCKLN